LSGPGSALAALAGGLVALFAICLLVRPDSFRHIARVVTRFGFKHAAAVEPVPLASLVPPFAFMVAAGLLAAFSFHIVAWTMTPWKFGDAGHAVAIFSIAALAGYLVPFVPSGAGIREAVIVALMAPFIGPAGALSVAIVARAVAVLVDVLVAALLGATYAGRFAFNRRIAI
jgi:hypothetical protein